MRGPKENPREGLEGVGATEDYGPRKPPPPPALWNEGLRQRSALEVHVALTVLLAT